MSNGYTNMTAAQWQGYVAALLGWPAWGNPYGLLLPWAAIEWAEGHGAYSVPMPVSLRAPRIRPAWMREVVIGGLA